MIIDNIDVSTEEGKKEFNEKHKGDLQVTGDNGDVILTGVHRKSSTISFDPNKGMFDSDNEIKIN